MSVHGRTVLLGMGLTVGTLALVSLLVYQRRKRRRLEAIEKELKGRNYDRNKALAAAEARQADPSTKQSENTKEELTGQKSTPGNPLQERRVDFEMLISREDVYTLRGKGGNNFRRIQKETNTRITQVGDPLENGDRKYVISGLPNDVEMAENKIKRLLMSQPVLSTTELTVPDRLLGRIIGRGGENIKAIQDASGAKVDIPRQVPDLSDSVYNEAGEPLRVIKVRGTEEQIQFAHRLIQDVIDEELSQRNRIKRAAAARTPRVNPKNDTSEADKDNHNSEPEVDQNPPAAILGNTERPMEVYVSCLYHPNSIYVQVFSKEYSELDKLVDLMTQYYTQHPRTDNESYTVGDMVAAYFSNDKKWHRARVVDVNDKKLEVEVIYVDYGDKQILPVKNVRRIQPHFLKLRFQAIELTLNLDPPGGPNAEWSTEAVNALVELTRPGQWARLLRAKIVDYLKDPTDGRDLVWVELHHKNVNIGEELVRQGHADLDNTAVTNGESTRKTSQNSNNSDSEGSVAAAAVAAT